MSLLAPAWPRPEDAELRSWLAAHVEADFDALECFLTSEASSPSFRKEDLEPDTYLSTSPCEELIASASRRDPWLRRAGGSDARPPSPTSDSTAAAPGRANSREPSATRCWGAAVSGTSASCDAEFVLTPSIRAHMKDKICQCCRANGVLVPACRVFRLSAALGWCPVNNRAAGIWSSGRDIGLGDYRLVNNTRSSLRARWPAVPCPRHVDATGWAASRPFPRTSSTPT